MGNNLQGVLLLDKPSGITSNQALQTVKRALSEIAKVKAGHTGSLDPLATGILPICLGEATKFAEFLLNADKEYIVTMQLGVQTDTGDLDGVIITTCSNICNINFTTNQVHEVVAKFIGEIKQVPPIYSAIKYQGQRCYKLARSNLVKNIILPPRQVKIYSIKILNICNQAKQITLQVNCSKGTYIRSLVSDLAIALGSIATVAKLRRTKIGDFTEDNLLNMSQLSSLIMDRNILSRLLPVEDILFRLPKLKISTLQALALRHGKKIFVDDLGVTLRKHLLGKCNYDNLFCLIVKDNNQFLGVAKYCRDTKLLAAKRLLQISSEVSLP